jgi:hypothetical protein
MAKAVYENNLDEAAALLDGVTSNAAFFGRINYYSTEDLKEWIGDMNISIEKVLGARTFFALHSNNEIRYEPVWQEKMFELEMKASTIKEYINIAFYNHVLLRKSL